MIESSPLRKSGVHWKREKSVIECPGEHGLLVFMNDQARNMSVILCRKTILACVHELLGSILSSSVVHVDGDDLFMRIDQMRPDAHLSNSDAFIHRSNYLPIGRSINLFGRTFRALECRRSSTSGCPTDSRTKGAPCLSVCLSIGRKGTI